MTPGFACTSAWQLPYLVNDEFSTTHDEIAKRVGRSRSSVTNLTRLLTLCAEVQESLRQGQMEMGHTRALLTLNREEQLITTRQIVDVQLSVREAENLVRKIKKPPPKQEKLAPIVAIDTLEWSKILSRKLATSVKVQLNNKGEGSVVIQINTFDEVKWLVDHISELKNQPSNY